LSVTDDIAGRVISLPMFDTMTEADTDEVIAVVRQQMSAHTVSPSMPAWSLPLDVTNAFRRHAAADQVH
jgi:hypothetical protein